MDYLGLGSSISFEDLGFSPSQVDVIQQTLPKKQGMVIVCGDESTPKVVAVHALVSGLMTYHQNIISIENTIWKEIRGVHQLQVRPDIGITAVASFRASMRQDPDVIALAMPLDKPEMLEICLQAALTGYFVVAVVNANGVMDCIKKLMGMCANPYLLAKGLQLILVQKSFSKLCDKCKTQYVIEEKIVNAYELPFKECCKTRHEGCEYCHGEGRYGEEFVSELLKVENMLRVQLADGNYENEVRKILDDPGYEGVWEKVLERVEAGELSLDEVLALKEETQE